MNILKRTLLVLLVFSSCFLNAQQIKKTLFIGNSYTYVNNLPQLIADIAHSKGDSLWWHSSTPGGYTFSMHYVLSATVNEISYTDWDFVVLQEQSQLPSFPPAQVLTQCFPYADSLNRFIKTNDSCTTTMFFMTWGWKNGDMDNCGAYPPVCTYLGMQQRLRESYLQMGQMFDAEVSPVGMAWKHVRDSFPAIELYQPDESHPSINGSYLAACTFYAAIYHNSPVGAVYPVGVTPADAAILQQVAHSTVFDSLSVWNIDTTNVFAGFTFTDQSGGQFQFNNSSINATSYYWDFGDGGTSSSANPLYTFSSSSSYNVTLIAQRGCLKDTLVIPVTVVVGVEENTVIKKDFSMHPVPADDYIVIDANAINNSGNPIIEICDLLGKQLLLSSVPPNGRIDVSGLPEGLYIIRLLASGRTSEEKLIICR